MDDPLLLSGSQTRAGQPGVSPLSDSKKFDRAGRRVFKLLNNLNLSSDMMLQILERAVAVTLPDVCDDACKYCL